MGEGPITLLYDETTGYLLHADGRNVFAFRHYPDVPVKFENIDAVKRYLNGIDEITGYVLTAELETK